jgi:hypothetical protein
MALALDSPDGSTSKPYWLYMAAADFADLALIPYHIGKPNRYRWTSFPFSTLRRWRLGAIGSIAFGKW